MIMWLLVLLAGLFTEQCGVCGWSCSARQKCSEVEAEEWLQLCEYLPD